jgi:uncharacterized protein (DUF2141 family)
LALVLAVLLAASFAGAQQPAAGGEVALLGRVHWPGKDLSQAQIRVFRDAARRDLVAGFPAMDETGQVVLALPPGTYYLMAVVDLDGDEKMGPGDGMGFYGVIDPATSQPAPFEVTAQTFEVTLVISLALTAEGKLAPTGVSAPAPPKPPRTLALSGTVSGLQEAGSAWVLLVPVTLGHSCHAVAVSREQPGFALRGVTAGPYFVFAIQDLSGDESLGSGDRMGVMGYTPELAETFPVVDLGEDRADLALELSWQIIGDGRLQALAGEALGPKVVLGTLPAIIYGQLPGPEKTPRTLLTASSDPHFSRVSARSETPGADYVLALAQGLYFLTVCQDRDDDGRTSPGDRLGFYGVTDLTRAHGPQPVYLRPGELRRVDIPLVAQLDEALQPRPLPATTETR